MTMSKNLRRRSMRLTALVVLGVALLLPDPAHAYFDGTKAYGEGRFLGCTNNGDGTYAADLSAYMREMGDSKVHAFGVVFLVYRLEVTSGWNFSYLRKSYKTGEFDADSPVNYHYTFTHRFGRVEQEPMRYDAKLTWARRWRRDYTATVTITNLPSCTGWSPGGS
jgi:hypothetical protein